MRWRRSGSPSSRGRGFGSPTPSPPASTSSKAAVPGSTRAGSGHAARQSPLAGGEPGSERRSNRSPSTATRSACTSGGRPSQWPIRRSNRAPPGALITSNASTASFMSPRISEKPRSVRQYYAAVNRDAPPDRVSAVTSGFTWRDGERVIRFGRGAIADAAALLAEPYTLLTTERAESAAPAVVAGARRVLRVGTGRVDELAGAMLGELDDAPLLVALGGGRVVDTAKALAAARPPRRVAAIPTTLSAAEMTDGHRRAAGTPQDVPGVRAAIVLNDPALSASQPEADMAASAANALGHAVEGPVTPRSSPVPALAAREAVRLIAGAWDGGEPDRDALALGALLSGYVIDATSYGLHHVMSQTLVRLAGIGHGPANAAMLPHTAAALRTRWPEPFDALGLDAVALAADLARRAGAASLRALGVTDAQLDECADAAAQRPELKLTPPPADRDELRALYAAAF